MVDFLSALLALIGLALICFGAFFAILAPGDGQTGMFVLPAWFFGIPCGLAGLIMSFWAELKPIKVFVWIVALLALAAVGWSFYASYRYEQDWQAKHNRAK